ncbi:ribosome small subunit-dependent GTPase A [Exilibacterium tricleocarpae]|uniref:Small ribosomal subunit biogenesis GTPase RsgA n=1 Tax=Exilibacterium tricleocarpae TaxID=2591008 RepID=A0A545TFT1_9GAMM|nr:ribosome small subunit-dependent GTPase A [Exilibacterium tricleocarpae]TQV76058.1 ribosome small subunit-dependent GTPase A [Exilibacterium tricleocarpae]
MFKISLPELGWKPFFQQQIALEEAGSHFAVRIVAQHRSQVVTWGAYGEQVLPIALLHKLAEVTVGDWLLINRNNQRPTRLLQRQTLIRRKAAGPAAATQLIAANLDTLFIVSSCNSEFNPARLERYLSVALEAGVLPVVVLTKADLCDDVAHYQRRAAKLRSGLLVECVNALDQTTLEGVSAWCRPGQTIALLGSSGVGKSTLAGALGVSGLATGEVRADDQKGRHTTTRRSLHRLPQGGLILDTPGMRELQLADCEDGVNALFEDVLVDSPCRFSDCTHTTEPGCAVQQAVANGELDSRRLHSYQKLLAEQRRNRETLAEKRQRLKTLGKTYKRIKEVSQQQKNKH